ncbi:protoporphyrinogen oxidase [Calidifontibacter sp. DB0510]|uniref:Coproporphyrinogen III oxidase n=1 Tax=Metallococcus carri TaxID=1656884 RepID=A0A967B178_9MICO|nr:protoporphyrinogen oxidase [Metallococcus carri]NOP37669.1 protoporphyrinogen oxidase [Calidifontibacter sp. DB2511S]
MAVVGGGITGLAAALELAGSGHEVHLLEGSDRIGGKLRLAQVGDHQVDVGAESMLARRPETGEIITAAGANTVHPQRLPAYIWSRGVLTPMPSGTVMGVPSDPRSLGGLLTGAEVDRAAHEVTVHTHSADESLGDLIARAFGPAVVDRLVEPLLGGVYAGHARLLSARACLPALFTAASEGAPLSSVARAAQPAPGATPAPVFAGLEGGVGRLPGELVLALEHRGVHLRVNAPVTHATRGADGRWRLRTGSTRSDDYLVADAVVLATPAAPTARLLGELSPSAVTELAAIDYASMAIVTFGYDASVAERFPESSGFLVPAVDGRSVKASTFSSRKWPWLAASAPDTFYVRASLGRHREVAVLQRSDAELAALAARELGEAVRADLPRPKAVHVQRWGGALPQYAVGHLDRVARARAALPEDGTVRLAGAAYDGVGIPACIASGRTAAQHILTSLQGGTVDHDNGEHEHERRPS